MVFQIRNGFFLAVLLTLSSVACWSETADRVLKDWKAHHKPQAIILLRSLAHEGDYVGLDKVQASAPELFSPETFTTQFFDQVIFQDPFQYARTHGMYVYASMPLLVPPASKLLTYLFQAGVPFPILSTTLPLIAWRQEIEALNVFFSTTNPNKKNEFEDDKQFDQRHSVYQKAVDHVFTTNLELPEAKLLNLGTYNRKGQFFSLTLNLSANDLLPNDNRVSTQAINSAMIRYYVPQRQAAFFKDREFLHWKYTVVLQALNPGDYQLKSLKVQDRSGNVEHLWAYQIHPFLTSSTGMVFGVENYIPGQSLTFSTAKEILKPQSVNQGEAIYSESLNTLYALTTSDGHLLWQGLRLPSESSPYLGNMMLVPAGDFIPKKGAKAIHVKSFYMSQNLVTNGQFKAVMGVAPNPDAGLSTRVITPNYPMQNVNWYQAIAFCNKLSLLEGLSPVYRVPGIYDWANLAYSQIPTFDNRYWDAALPDPSANGYRLPTAVQYVWASMGATQDSLSEDFQNKINVLGYLKGYAGSEEPNGGQNLIDNYAWTSSNSWNYFYPVGQKLPNELGIYDLSGNLQEWCEDFHVDQDGMKRLITLGSYSNPTASCALTKFHPLLEFAYNRSLGFRVVR